MPGTIIVSVLDFKGLQSSLSTTPPQISIKVSMGKREYQTWAMEDFSIPLTTLRDDLTITINDAGGNEISHTGVETRMVVEKGLWDGILPLEGGGQMHLKLQFVLSEEERRQIREMRESALRKKLGELASGNLGSPENATTVSSNAARSLRLNHEVSDLQKSILQSEAVATQAATVSTPAYVIMNTGLGTKEREETFSVEKQTIPIDARTLHQLPVSQGFDAHETEVSNRDLVEKIETQTPPEDVLERILCSEEASSLSKSSEFVDASQKKVIAPKQEEDGIGTPEKTAPMRKISSVKNMISAIEGSLAQDMRPVKPQPSKPQSSKIGTEAPLKSLILDEVKTEKTKPTQPISGRIQSPFLVGKSQESSTQTMKLELKQDVRPHVKPQPAKSQSSKIGTEAAQESLNLDEVKTEKIIPTQLISGRIKVPFSAGESPEDAIYTTKTGYQLSSVRAFNEATTSQGTGQFELSAMDNKNKQMTVDMKNKLVHKENDIKEDKNYSEDLMRPSTDKAATVSGRILDEHICTQQPGKLFVNKRRSGGKLSIKESEEGIDTEHLEDVDNQGTSNDILESKEKLKDKYYFPECPGTWIFPVESSRTCVTTGSKQMMDLMEICHAETEIHLGKKSSAPENVEKCSMHDGEIKINEPELKSIGNIETSGGPVRQAMRVVIMLGFATLVILTRQRKTK